MRSKERVTTRARGLQAGARAFNFKNLSQTGSVEAVAENVLRLVDSMMN
jgi:hypothetical protein